MPPRPSPYVTDSARMGLMAEQPWHRKARRLKMDGNGNRTISKLLGVSTFALSQFFNPEACKRHRAHRKAERVAARAEPAAVQHERERNRERRAARKARDPEGYRAEIKRRRDAQYARVKADPKRRAHDLAVRAASARWRAKKRKMIAANAAYRKQSQPEHAST